MLVNEKVALFGGTGLIGSAVGRALCAKGYMVVVFARNIDKARRNVPGAVYKKIGSLESLSEDLDGIGAVLNFTGSPIFSKKSKDVESSRVGFVKNLVNVISGLPKPPSVFINGSATGYYGYDNSPETELTEDVPAGKDYWGDLVSRWEDEANKASRIGIRVVNIRTSVVLSTNGGALKQLYPTFRWYFGGFVKPGSQWFSWIHLDDEVNLIIAALTNDSYSGSINASSPNPTQIREFTDILGVVMHRPSSIPIPSFVIRLRFGKSADLIFKGGKISSSKLKQLGFSFKFPELMPALSDVIRRGV